MDKPLSDKEIKEGFYKVYNYAIHSLNEGRNREEIIKSASSEIGNINFIILAVDAAIKDRKRNLEIDACRAKNRKEYYKGERGERALRFLGIGMVLIFVGAVLTGVTYYFADPGEHFIITSGAFIGGGFMILRGLFGLLGARFW